LHYHRFAGRENSFLVAVGFTLTKVFDHRQAHGLRRAVTKQARVADIQGNDLVTLPLEFACPCRQFTANFIPYTLEDVIGFNGCFMQFQLLCLQCREYPIWCALSPLQCR
jgi:hypothetical protein